MSTQTTDVSSKLDALESVFGNSIARVIRFMSQLRYDAKTNKYIWEREADGLTDLGIINAMGGIGMPVPLVGGYEIPSADGLPEKLFNADPARVAATALNAAAASLKQTGEIAWKLLQVSKDAPIDSSQVTIDVSSNALKYVLTVAGSALAAGIPDNQSSVTVARDVLALMAIELRKNIPAAMSALFAAQLAVLPSGNGLQLVDMSGWLGSALYNADGSATGLFNILKLEGFDPSVMVTGR